MPTAPPQLPPSEPIRLIAIDVDGTLLTSDHKVAPGAPEAIREAHTLGMMPVLMTGRSTLAIRPYFETLDLSPYCIGAGGAFIARINGEVISVAPIHLEHAAEIVRRVRERGMGLCFHGVDRFICEVDDETFASLLDIVGSTAERAKDVLRAVDADPMKITIFGNRGQLEELNRELAALDLPVTTTFSGPSFLEVTHEGVSKGRALAHLAEVLDVPLDQVAAIGDQENDLSAFEVAGFSAAMGNAPQIVKAAADFVAPSNDEGGLAVALRALARWREAHESQD